MLLLLFEIFINHIGDGLVALFKTGIATDVAGGDDRKVALRCNPDDGIKHGVGSRVGEGFAF